MSQQLWLPGASDICTSNEINAEITAVECLPVITFDILWKSNFCWLDPPLWANCKTSHLHLCIWLLFKVIYSALKLQYIYCSYMHSMDTGVTVVLTLLYQKCYKNRRPADMFKCTYFMCHICCKNIAISTRSKITIMTGVLQAYGFIGPWSIFTIHP